jgi:hypothetical protein
MNTRTLLSAEYELKRLLPHGCTARRLVGVGLVPALPGPSTVEREPTGTY